MTLVTSDAGRGLAWAPVGRLFTVIVVLPLMSVLFDCSRLRQTRLARIYLLRVQ